MANNTFGNPPDPQQMLTDAAQQARGISSQDLQFASGSIQRKTQELHGERWNEVHTYEFVIVEASSDDGSVRRGVPVDAGKFPKLFASDYQLDLPPQAMTVTTQFASNVTASNNGVLEENAGTVFRMINISGTTSILPGRKTQSNTGFLGGTIISKLFPAATQAVGALASLASSIVSSVPSAGTPPALQQTGYYRFWSLHNFLVAYSEVKKQPNASNLRLIFRSPKDNIGYICTPVVFELRRDKDEPLQYRYNIQLKCWDIESDVAASPKAFDGSEAGSVAYAKGILNKIRQARKTILGASNVVRGFQSDIQDVMQVFNQTALAVKDVVGVGASVADVLPTIKNNAALLAKTTTTQFQTAFQDFTTANNNLNSLLSSEPAANITVQSSPTGEVSDLAQSSSSNVQALNSVLDNPDAVDSVDLASLGTLPATVQSQIDDQIAQSKTITSGQVRNLANKLQEVSDNLAYYAGMMDPVYAQTYGLPAPGEGNRAPTEDDILLSVALQEAKTAYLSSLSNGVLFGEKEPNPFTAANQAMAPDDQIPTPASAFPVFVERGASLDRMALTYLGDANRAREIAILNHLRAPYIDEAGFSQPISLASGRTFLVSDRSKLVINQKVKLQGGSNIPTRRTILDIEDVGDGNFKITVDGPTDLDRFTSASSPTLSARLPGTVGSGDTILIPSPDAPDETQIDRSTSLLARLTHAERVFRIDLALTDSGDINVSPSGDVARSYGYQNAVQALKILLETEIGELDQHQNFGIPTQIGQRVTGVTLTQAQSLIKAAIVNDARFSSAVVSITPNGSVFTVRVEVTGTEGTGRIPVEFEVKAA